MIISQTNKQNHKKKINDKRDDDTEDDQDDSHIMVCDRDTTDKESLERKNLLNAPHTMDIAVIIIIIIIIVFFLYMARSLHCLNEIFCLCLCIFRVSQKKRTFRPANIPNHPLIWWSGIDNPLLIDGKSERAFFLDTLYVYIGDHYFWVV